MSTPGPAPSRLRWLAENKIPLRIGSLSAVLLGALVISTVFMAFDLMNNLRRIQDANTRFHRLQIAASADRHFGEMRYWMTDLSVSLLTLSERRANAARTELEADLTRLEEFAPDAAGKIRAGTAAYYARALDAADAYTDGNRIIGNTLLAEARLGSDAVDQTLGQLVAQLADEADQANRSATLASQRSVMRALIACVVILIAGAALTWLVLRSILTPLDKVNRAIAALNEGETDVALPPEGKDEFGRISQTLRTLRDSQEMRRRLEEAAEAQRNTIMTAIETIPDGFALFDAEDRVLLMNARFRKIFTGVDDILEPGTAFEQILRAQVERGTVDTGGLPGEDWVAARLRFHRHPDELRQVLRIGGAWVQVTKRKTPDGGTVAVYSDITDLKDKQEELEEARAGAEAANEAKSRFLASMSHELRTPLNAIIGYSEMLIEDARDIGQEEPVDDLEKIMASGRHLLSLINDVLDLSKIEAGKMELYVETFALRPLLAEVEATVAPLIAKNGNRLIVDAQIDPDEIATDKTKLRQNLFNLLSNAAKFTSGGTITLSVKRVRRGGQEMFEFIVADDGIGMNDVQKSKLFQAFVQADSSTTRNYGGTGLGLAIAQQFTRMMGGHITVESQEGAGSAFSFAIPVSFSAQPQAGAGAQEAAHAGRVLVIDDEASARSAVARLVRDEGYDVFTASNAEDGLSLARRHRPDAIILDVIMPERDGWSVLKELKSDPDLCETPVILSTVVTDREMGLAFGAVDHLTKPVDPKRLISTLNAVAGDRDREVLIVDDDAATRTLFRRILVREGWQVREASDGQRALSQLETRRPTLIVLDLLMPNLDGFEVLRALKANAALRDLPVIVVTSKDLSGEELAWLKSHAGDVIKKGQNGRSELVAALKRHMAA
ncbi:MULTISPECIES: hybrid sensor histidine kinase/response regulator [Actibacterium]|uniref:histidine kinase n=1 Tax=Actibacterium naphthalenivorans TaxID=1614693 RepID=A0A840C8H0_9RHOB|nr:MULTISPECIES: response regulator [Actibacterium]ALG90325.1 hypothetical protein TQ29_09100 [Actibacterium sp. EMB200-NS6]MBB4022241.1 signal transduction histidine kinase/DNA-binding response OmpR family regulator [Actibacterium naphthalenivorans]